MAEAQVTDESTHENSVFDSTSELNSSVLECAVCLQTCVHPAQLPCGHIFCFLCIKGVANQSKRCAMCRQEIPSDYFDKPHLVEQSASVKESAVSDDGYQWFYEGRNGWWQYDERTSRELENAYKKGERTCELLIAGFLYVADFDAMLQLRRSELTRRRRIKRDLATIPKKGVAGLRLEGCQYEEPPRAKSPSSVSTTSSAGDGSSTPIPPTNTPQTPAGGNTSGDTTPDRRESIHQAMEQIRSLCLREVSDSSGDEGEASEAASIPDDETASSWVHTLSFDEDHL